MDQLSVPLDRLPQFGFQPTAYPDGDSDAVNNSSSPPIWNADGLSTLSMPAPNGSDAGPSSAFGSFGSALGFGNIGSIVQQLVGLLQQLLQVLTGGGISQSGAVNSPSTDPQEYFNSANGASQGDPHLSFSGLDGSNHLETSRFDSMTDHPNLLNSSSFPGGYQLSTTVGAPRSNGATLNQSATIATNFGRTNVSMNGDGSVSISRCGKPLSIADGQTLDLGHGETATKNSDGSLTVVNTNAQGGRIATTLKPNSSGGVDVSADANGVDLGGDLVTEAQNNGNFGLQNLNGSYEPRPRFWFAPTIQ